MKTATAPQQFQIKIAQSELDDLHLRLDATRWPEPAPDARADFERGVPLGYLQRLTSYWRRDFDWRAQEDWLNQIPQFTTEIDGQQFHYLHVRSPEPEALPLMIIHGYPSSVVEFYDLIGPLSDPRSHGGDPGRVRPRHPIAAWLWVLDSGTADRLGARSDNGCIC